MPRAVDSWLHRICIRKFGPANPTEKLFLFGINSHMDEAGECFPGQEELSNSTALGVSTIRRVAAVVSKQGWIAIYSRGASGRKWKSYAYRACVPDWVDLASIKYREKDGEYMATHHESVWGLIEESAVSGSLYPQKGKPRRPPAPGGSSAPVKTEASTGHSASTARSRSDDRPQRADRPPADSAHDRPQRRGKFSSEVPIQVNSVKVLQAAPPDVFSHGKNPERKHSEFPTKQQSITDRDLLTEAYAIGELCEFKVAVIAKMLSPRYLDVNEDRLWRVIRADQSKRDARKVIA